MQIGKLSYVIWEVALGNGKELGDNWDHASEVADNTSRYLLTIVCLQEPARVISAFGNRKDPR
jgi:hypothetical protein